MQALPDQWTGRKHIGDRQLATSYEPRRPDFTEVACGFTLGVTFVVLGGFSCCSALRFCRNADLGPFDEKSGMPRGDFFFIAPPGEMTP